MKNIGRKFRVHLKDGSSVEGKLEQIEDGKLRLLPDAEKRKKSQVAAQVGGDHAEEIEKANVSVTAQEKWRSSI